MDGSEPPVLTAARELSTWQEVAVYLGVSVRTAQKWEVSRGLPIRRSVGDRARVRARTDELDAWQQEERAKRVSVLAPAGHRRVIWLLVAAGIVVAVAVGYWLIGNRGWSAEAPRRTGWAVSAILCKRLAAQSAIRGPVNRNRP